MSHGPGSKTRILIGIMALALVPVLSFSALADGPSAVAWLKAQQNADGGFGSPQSSVGATADVLLAVASTGDNAIGWVAPGKGPGGTNTPLTYLEANVGSITKAGNAAKVILALIASLPPAGGKSLRDLGGVDLVAKLEAMVGSDGKIGGESDFINDHCYAMVALSSAKRAVPAASVNYLLERQIADGTWSWNGDTSVGSGDNNTAAIAVVALIAAGVPADNAQIQKTLAHFETQQNEDGGFPYINPSPYGTDSDSNSTAVVMWAIKAAGQDPAGVDWKYQGQDGHSALDKLRAFQNDSGAFRWQDTVPADNLASTVQALVALEMKTLPFATMDVGGATVEVAIGVPETLPETGGNQAHASPEPSARDRVGPLWVLVLLISGATLTGVGLGLRGPTQWARS